MDREYQLELFVTDDLDQANHAPDAIGPVIWDNRWGYSRYARVIRKPVTSETNTSTFDTSGEDYSNVPDQKRA